MRRLTAFERLGNAVKEWNPCIMSPQDARTVLGYIHSRDEIVGRLRCALKKYACELADIKGSPKPNIISISGAFDENALRADIVRVWGESEEHVEVFDDLVRALKQKEGTG